MKNRPHSHYLLLGAFAGELAPFHERFAGREDVSLVEVGIGLVEAAIGTEKALIECREKFSSPVRVVTIFVGSVGACERSVPLLSFVSASSVSLFDSAVALGESYFPEQMFREVVADRELSQYLGRGRDGGEVLCEPIQSTLAITSEVKTDGSLRFENLELFAVASACKRENISWAALMCVTNYIGAEAQKQWKFNFDEAAKRTAAFLSSLL